MSRSTVAAVFVVALLLVGLSTPPVKAFEDRCVGRITVTVEHVSSDSNFVSITDAINGESKFNGTMKPWAKQTLPICSSEAGYGRLHYKKGGQSSWTEANLLRDGDTVKI